jgi:hypothetical protein
MKKPTANIGFVQVGLDVDTSAVCKHKHQFQHDKQHSATE